MKNRKNKPKEDQGLRIQLNTPDIKDEMIRIPGFPIIPSGDRVVIKAIDQAEMVSKSGIVVIETRDNKSRAARIVSISPELYNLQRHPHFFYRPGDLVYFNHQAGNHMRMAYRNELGDFYVMYIMDILGLFAGDEEEYFGKEVAPITTSEMMKSMNSTSATGPVIIKSITDEEVN